MVGRLDSPRQAIMQIDSADEDELQAMAFDAVEKCRSHLPRVTGAAAATVTPIWGDDWFGVEWIHDSIWYQEAGIRPFTMRSLSGKTIPMWLNDRDGELQRKNPKAKTRRREDTGETQVLVFRRAAKQGQRKQITRNQGGQMITRDVPASYPGAPGRIAVNRSQGIMRAGDVDRNSRNPGQIARQNVGVRWRHPGLDAGKYVMRGVAEAADAAGYPVGKVQYLPAGQAFTGALFDIVIARS